MKRKYEGGQGIGVRFYGAIILIIDIFVLLGKVIYEYSQSFVQLFVKPELKDISKETVLITGTGHGIGRELALQYAEFGCKVICVDLNENNNSKTVKEIKSLKKGNSFGYQCDVTNRDEVLKLAKKTYQEVGPVTVIINNAGIMPCHPLGETSEGEIRKIFDVNVLAHFWILEGFLPHLIERGAGHIIGLSSMAGLMGFKNLVPYCGSKYAVRGILEAITEEFRGDSSKSQINCTSIHPYMVDTGLCKNPRIRFPSLMGLVTPTEAAASIIDAHRRNMREATIPRHWYSLNSVMRTMPYKAALHFKDFFDTGVDSDNFKN